MVESSDINFSQRTISALVFLFSEIRSNTTTSQNATENKSPPAGDRAMTSLSLRERFCLATLGHDQETEGQGLVEYALIIMLIAIVAISAVAAMGVGVKTTLYDVIVAAWPG
jgi:Flp pilus assembly pilin Flp